MMPRTSLRHRERMATLKKGRAVAFSLLAATALSACEPRISTHGYVPDPDVVSRVEPGVHNQLEVAQLLGTPSTAALFGEQTWLYITERREEFAFFKPEIVSQDVLAIAFDDRGVVHEIASFSLEDGLVVDPVSLTTPTYGKKLGLLEQLFGNIGRFNTEGQQGVKVPGQ